MCIVIASVELPSACSLFFFGNWLPVVVVRKSKMKNDQARVRVGKLNYEVGSFRVREQRSAKEFRGLPPPLLVCERVR